MGVWPLNYTIYHTVCLLCGVIARSNLSQVPPLHMHVGKKLAALLATKRSANVAPEVDLRESTLHLPAQKKCE